MRGPAADLFSSATPGVDFYFVADPKPHRLFHDEDYLDRWTPIQISLADLLNCEIEQVAIREAFWGKDNYAEVVTMDGQIVGSFYRPVSKAVAVGIGRRLLDGEVKAKTKRPRKPKPRIDGQREMLLPIAGNKPAADGAKVADPEKKPTSARRKAG